MDIPQFEKQVLEEIASLTTINDALYEYASPERVGKKTNAEKQALTIISQSSIKKYLCPALKSASNDVYDIAKIIVPVLIPLILANTISIPLEPVIFASVALVISRMGVATICIDDNKKVRNKK